MKTTIVQFKENFSKISYLISNLNQELHRLSDEKNASVDEEILKWVSLAYIEAFQPVPFQAFANNILEYYVSPSFLEKLKHLALELKNSGKEKLYDSFTEICQHLYADDWNKGNMIITEERSSLDENYPTSLPKNYLFWNQGDISPDLKPFSKEVIGAIYQKYKTHLDYLDTQIEAITNERLGSSCREKGQHLSLRYNSYLIELFKAALIGLDNGSHQWLSNAPKAAEIIALGHGMSNIKSIAKDPQIALTEIALLIAHDFAEMVECNLGIQQLERLNEVKSPVREELIRDKADILAHYKQLINFGRDFCKKFSFTFQETQRSEKITALFCPLEVEQRRFEMN